MERLGRVVTQNAVVIFSKSVSPAVYELDTIDTWGKELDWALSRLTGCAPAPFPAVFVGGKFVGSSTAVMTLYLNGSLKKLLKEAGALWL